MKFYSCLKLLFVIACVFCSRSQSLNAQFLGTMTAGHADIGVGFANNNLEPHIHADTALSLFGGGALPVGEYEADQVWFGIGDSLKQTRPTNGSGFGDPRFNFLGVNPGQDFWLLPGTSASDRPFIGFGTEELGTTNGWGAVTFTLNNINPIRGASQFSAWQVAGDGSIINMITTTTSGSLNKSFSLAAGSHDHWNMAFTGPGIFEVAFTVSASRTQGTTTTPFSATESFTFAVGNANFTAVPEPSSFALIATLSSVGAAWRYRKRLGSKISRN